MTSSDKPPSPSPRSSHEHTVDVRAVGISDDEVPDDISEVASAAFSYLERSEYRGPGAYPPREGIEVSILFCDDPWIHELNRRYRGKDSATDVLSFSQTETSPDDPTDPTGRSETRGEGASAHIGDIVVSIDSVRSNAEEWAVPYVQELRRVVVHGLLHLLGMDHETNEPDQEMLQVQEQILAAISEEHKL
jgi:probable rRNA maturation factor